MIPAISGLFLREGTSDDPLSDLVEELFARAGVELRLTAPDFSRLPDERSSTLDAKVRHGLELAEGPTDIIVIHRDADTAGRRERLAEMAAALRTVELDTPLVPIIPVRMTEAWLLLDDVAIRKVAGNPNGRTALELPARREAERTADPKAVLRAALLTAADTRGRRRREAERRFPAHRRRLLAELDIDGPVSELASWRELETSVQEIADRVGSARRPRRTGRSPARNLRR